MSNIFGSGSSPPPKLDETLLPSTISIVGNFGKCSIGELIFYKLNAHMFRFTVDGKFKLPILITMLTRVSHYII